MRSGSSDGPGTVKRLTILAFAFTSWAAGSAGGNGTTTPPPGAIVAGVVKTDSGRGVPRAVVYVAGLKDGKPPEKKTTLEQTGKSFNPHVLAVVVGTVVDFPNHDEVLHNVFSLYHGKRFDLGLYPPGSKKSILFDKPGIHAIFCNIHPQMNGYILTLENPYFAITGEKGEYEIKNLPPGDYKLKVWHESLGEQELKVSLTPGGKVALDVILKKGKT